MAAYRFSELEYRPTDFEKVKALISSLEERARNANTRDELESVLLEYDKAIEECAYSNTLAFIRSSLDASDAFYQEAIGRESQGCALLDTTPLLRAILGNKCFPLLEEKYGTYLGVRLRKGIETGAKAQEEMAEIEGLTNDYQREKAMTRVSWRGEMVSEGAMMPLFDDKDRSVRLEARKAVMEAFVEKKELLGGMLERMVALRDKVAKENGFKNYLEYMNSSYQRFGYGEEELTAFQEEVKRYAVPLQREIFEEAAKRLGIERIMSHDTSIMFPDGNARPIGDDKAMTEASKRAYCKMDEAIGEFFHAMVDSESIDVGFSPNKVSNMGFCTTLKSGMYPYIFGSLNGSEWDVNVFTHEFGHAWQQYSSDKKMPLYLFMDMPLDAVEIPSKTMELLSYPYAEEFFGIDADKFRFSHFRNAIKEIVSYTAVHELNTWIYTHVGATFDEINEAWLAIQKEYYPGVENGELEELNRKGGSLLRNMGVFMFPRYLISYALSEICALDIFSLYQKDKKAALEKYNILCQQGGDKSYPEILASAGLEPAYKKGRVKAAIEGAREYMKKN